MRLAIISVVFLLFCYACGTAAKTKSATNGAAITHSDTEMSGAPDSIQAAVRQSASIAGKIQQKLQIPGLSIAVAINNQLIWSQAFGLANVETNSPVSNNTKFRIASISKLLTGTAVAKLAEQDLLGLDVSITTYLPDSPTAWRPITVRHLAEHSSGIAHYTSVEDAFDYRYFADTKTALDKFRSRPLVHPPGERRTYSSYAYTVLAAIIESVTGKDFLDAMQELVFFPLKMRNTVPDIPHQIVPDRSAYYEKSADNELQHSPFINLSGRLAGSGFLSTASDLALFGGAHTQPGFLSQSTLNLLGETRVLGNGESDESLGWGPRTGWEGRPLLWGDGRTPGARGGLLVFPKQGLSIAILTNLRTAAIERGDFQAIAKRFLSVIEKQPLKSIPKTKFGEYSIAVEAGERLLRGHLEFSQHSGQTDGKLVFTDIQTFELIDGFVQGETTWLYALSDGQGPIPKVILPLAFQHSEGRIEGEIFRTGFTFTGQKQ